MAYPDNLLVSGERVVVNKRPHWKVLVLPTILFIVIIGAGSALAAWVNSRDMSNASLIYWIIIIAAVIALVILVVVPFVRWRTEHFVITNHHVFFRTGLLSRREHQIPLGQIANMETEVTFWGRLMGYGSLIVESSADQPLKFRNVASLSKIQATLNQLIRDERERTHRRGNDFDDGPDDRRQAPPQQYAAPGYQQQPYPTQQYPQQGQYPAQGQYPQGQYPPQGQYQQGQYPAQGQHPTEGQHPTQGQYPQQGQYPAQGQYPPQDQGSTAPQS
jgi:membrane protein YdbS with pleckstrin-like domain